MDIYVTIQDYFGLLEHKITNCSQNVRLFIRGLYSFAWLCIAKMEVGGRLRMFGYLLR